MILIFTGPPFAGKDTQAKLLQEQLRIPIFSMGHLIRQAYDAGNPKAVEGFEQYSLKGLHLPNSLKFDLLKERMDQHVEGFMLDNYPATQEDLDTFLHYLQEKNLLVNKVFYITISESEMRKRMEINRGRADDDPEIVMKRRQAQDKDREPVIEYFKSNNLLSEINGEQSKEVVHQQIVKELNI